MKAKKEELKEEDIQLLRTGISDNVNLLNENELEEIFGGYIKCPNSYTYCDPGYCACTNTYHFR